MFLFSISLLLLSQQLHPQLRCLLLSRWIWIRRFHLLLISLPLSWLHPIIRPFRSKWVRVFNMSHRTWKKVLNWWLWCLELKLDYSLPVYWMIQVLKTRNEYQWFFKRQFVNVKKRLSAMKWIFEVVVNRLYQIDFNNSMTMSELKECEENEKRELEALEAWMMNEW